MSTLNPAAMVVAVLTTLCAIAGVVSTLFSCHLALLLWVLAFLGQTIRVVMLIRELRKAREG